MGMRKQERDLRDLVFGDSLGETSEAELHAISSHPERGEELNRLLRLRESLLSLAEEEPPRRIVLATPPREERRRWWQLGFASPGWGFAGACALAAAIVFHALWTPAPADPSQVAFAPDPRPLPSETAPVPDETRIQSLVDARVAAAVSQMREDLNAAHRRETARLVSAAETRLREEHEQELMQMREAVNYMNKQFGTQLVANVALANELRARELQ